MTNPFKKHSSGLFANHGSNIDQAMTYSMSLIDTLHGNDKVAAMTAIMVLINSASSAFDEVPAAVPAGPSPERLVLMELIDQRIGEHKLLREDDLEGKLADWARDELDIAQSIENWADDNLDDKIQDAIGNMEATVSFR